MARKFTKEQLKKLPKYVTMGKSSALRLYNSHGDGDTQGYAEYYRDAGNWSVDIRIDKKTGKLYSVSMYEDTPWLNGVELIPISRKKWADDNGKYINKNTRASYTKKTVIYDDEYNDGDDLCY